jgi:hypothetical protein
VTYRATDVDPTSDVLTWILATNASWLSIDAGTGILSGTPASSGTFWVNVTVSDGNGGVDWSYFNLTVQGASGGTEQPGNPVPLILAVVALAIAGLDLALRFKKSKKLERAPPEPSNSPMAKTG